MTRNPGQPLGNPWEGLHYVKQNTTIDVKTPLYVELLLSQYKCPEGTPFYCIYSENFRQQTLQIEFYMRYIFTYEKSDTSNQLCVQHFFTCENITNHRSR